MGAVEVVALIGTLLSASGEISKIAGQALDAWRAGDDQKALDLCDQALAKQSADLMAARLELDAVRVRVAQRIADKFNKGGTT